MGAITRMMVSVFLAFCVVGGAVYLVLKTDKIPVLNERQAAPVENAVDNISLGRRDISHTIIGQLVPVGSVVKCLEGGKVVYSNIGCKDGVNANAVEMHHAAGIVSPSREMIDATVSRMFVERAAENRRLEEIARRPISVNYQPQVGFDQCRWLHDQNSDIDRESNQALTSWRQEQIRLHKYKNIKKQFELHC